MIFDQPSSLQRPKLGRHYSVQLALQCLNLGSQCLHLQCLRCNRLCLFGDQVFDQLDVVLGDGSGGRRSLASG